MAGMAPLPTRHVFDLVPHHCHPCSLCLSSTGLNISQADQVCSFALLSLNLELLSEAYPDHLT